MRKFTVVNLFSGQEHSVISDTPENAVYALLIDELRVDWAEYTKVYTPHCFNLVNKFDDRVTFSVFRFR